MEVYLVAISDIGFNHSRALFKVHFVGDPVCFKTFIHCSKWINQRNEMLNIFKRDNNIMDTADEIMAVCN